MNVARPGRTLLLACAIGASVLGFSAGSVSAPAAPVLDPARPGTLVRLPDGRRINLRCIGAGAPTVLFEGGFGATSLAWYKVQPVVAKRHRACSYDRAGSGFSDPGAFPRDGAAVAADLDHSLRATHIQGPFVVVGHSAGGLYVRLFADRRPRDVVGMVLVEPSVEYQDRRFAAAFGPKAQSLAPLKARTERCLAAARQGALPSPDPTLAACGPKPTASAAEIAQARNPATWLTQISELDNLWTRTSDEVAEGRASYGAMPLVVLTADGTYASAPPRAREAVSALWASLHQEIASRSSRGSARMVEHSSHMMIFDRPDAIVTAIDDVIAAARKP